MRRLALVIAALGLAGPALAQPAPGGESPCHADRARFAVGQPYTKALARRAVSRSGARAARIVRPGRAYTMEFRADRFTLEIGPRGRIRAVRCG
jgi:hypothetical protein